MGGQHGRLRGELGAALRTDHSWEVLEAGRGVALKLPRPGIEGREGGLGEAPGGRTVMEEARWVVGRGERVHPQPLPPGSAGQHFPTRRTDRKSTRLNSSHTLASRMPSSA